LHDARHTAAAVQLLLGVPERAAMGVMGWSTTAMAARYQHVTDPIRQDIAERSVVCCGLPKPKTVRAIETKPETTAERRDGP
jgi:hypothetical protein